MSKELNKSVGNWSLKHTTGKFFGRRRFFKYASLAAGSFSLLVACSQNTDNPSASAPEAETATEVADEATETASTSKASRQKIRIGYQTGDINNITMVAFEATVKPVPGETFVPASIEVPKDSLHVKALKKAYRRLLGKDPVIYRKNAYCDTLRFSHSGIPSITFGPGEDGWSPINECINVDKVVAATQIYALASIDLLEAKVF